MRIVALEAVEESQAVGRRGNGEAWGHGVDASGHWGGRASYPLDVIKVHRARAPRQRGGVGLRGKRQQVLASGRGGMSRSRVGEERRMREGLPTARSGRMGSKVIIGM